MPLSPAGPPPLDAIAACRLPLLEGGPRAATRCRRPGLGLVALLVAAAAACEPADTAAAEDPETGTPSTATEAPSARQTSADLRGEVRDLIVAVTPPPPTATAGFKNDWFDTRRRTLERLRAGGPELGQAVLEEYRERDGAQHEVRIGLLDVAAHCLPEEVRPLLVELITTFGDSLAVRTAACDLLARTSPATAVEVLGAILAEERQRITYPPEEQMLRAWVEAARHEGIDAGAFLGDIAVQLQRDHATRQAAVRALASCEGPAAVEALRTVMVESSGNHFLRRTAAQGLLELLPREEFCAFARDVLELESEQGFQLFLADMIDDNCGS